MSKKVYSVIITLPDLAAAHAEHEVTVESASWSQAIKLACEEVSRRPHVLGKHVKSAKIFFSVVAGHAEAEVRETSQPANPQEPNQGALFDI